MSAWEMMKALYRCETLETPLNPNVSGAAHQVQSNQWSSLHS